MRYVKDYDEALDIFRALGSEIRIQLIKLLLMSGPMSMNDLAKALGISNGALTGHIRKLEAADLVRISSDPAAHGNQKMCIPHIEKILIIFARSASAPNEYRSHLRAGQYSSCEVYPTCGLATAEKILGEVDDPRYFTHPGHFDADILWFAKGYVEYMMPCIIPYDHMIEKLFICAELSSEAPGSNPVWPSDIHFYINGIEIGVWTSPGDFADVRGLFTPDWWFSNWNQYGLLKTICVSEDGTYLDEIRISDVTIDQLHLSARHPVLFRMAVPDTAKHIGGLTVFGRGYGNVNQDIEFRIVYSKEPRRLQHDSDT